MSSSSSANFSESATICVALSVSRQGQKRGTYSVNLLLRESASLVLDRDRGGLSSPLVGRRDLHDTRGINLERDLDLGHTAGRRGDTRELELSKMVVVAGHRAFSLEDLDEHDGLCRIRQRCTAQQG